MLIRLIFCAGLFFFFQAQDGDRSPACDNAYNNPHKCECNRAKECPRPDGATEPGPKCSRYCKPDKCKCISSC